MMALFRLERFRRGDLDPALAVQEVLVHLRQDCTEARFQVRAAEADLRRLEVEAADVPVGDEWSKQLSHHRQQVASLVEELGRLERKREEAEAYAQSLSARASSVRARMSLTEFMSELETGDSVEVFDRLKDVLRDLEFGAQGLEEVRDILD